MLALNTPFGTACVQSKITLETEQCMHQCHSIQARRDTLMLALCASCVTTCISDHATAFFFPLSPASDTTHARAFFAYTSGYELTGISHPFSSWKQMVLLKKRACPDFHLPGEYHCHGYLFFPVTI